MDSDPSVASLLQDDGIALFVHGLASGRLSISQVLVVK
jgi:hypothetical protein